MLVIAIIETMRRRNPSRYRLDDRYTRQMLRFMGKARKRSQRPKKPGTWRMYEYSGSHARLIRHVNRVNKLGRYRP